MTERPLLRAEWRDLLLINFRVPVETVACLAPHGTEPDLHDGQTFVSVVGFDFRRVRLWGMAFPGHTRFPEINLRYYVRRRVGGEVRRGVVFLREVVPRRAAALIANFLFHENYIARPMRNESCKAGKSLAPATRWNTPGQPARAGARRQVGIACPRASPAHCNYRQPARWRSSSSSITGAMYVAVMAPRENIG